MAEFFSVAVAWGLFLIFWNTREIIENRSLILLGVAYLFVGAIDLIHTLSYKGMGVLGPETGANPATQLWIFARYLESVSLLLFSTVRMKSVNTVRVMLCYGVILTLGLLSIFYWKIFPACYVDGAGLTNFKIFSEYIICAILILSLLLFTKKKAYFDETVFFSMTAAIILTIFAELAFTFYVSVFDLSNLLGHYFKIVSFYFIYKALIQSGLTRPFATLFRDMEKERQALRASESKYRQLFESLKDPVYISTIEGTVMDANPAFFSLFGYTTDDLGQLKTQDLYVNPENRAGFIKALKKSGFVKDHLEKLRTRDGSEMDCLVTATFRRSGDGEILGYQGSIRDISEVRRKDLEKEELISELQDALAEVKKLSGLLPICMHCKKIRDDKGYWNQLESYIHEHSDAEFSHSICKGCAEKYYPDMDLYDD
jgi:PAS domain S-box-containing protein